MMRASVVVLLVCLLSDASCARQPTSAGTIALDKQCGGTGGDCAALKECVDAPWTKKTCSGNLGCQRINVWWWQCKDGTSTPVGHTGPIPINQQCGGKGGECDYYKQCKDAPFTARTCAKGLSCQRVSEWHWQCKSGSPSQAPSPVSTGAIGQDQQCGGTGGDCAAYKQCVDAPWTGRKCAAGLSCRRVNIWWWQCKKGPSTPVVTTGPIAIDQQCGGKGGECDYYKQCKDAPFTARSCTMGLSCKRVSEWHWQCTK